MSPALVFGAYIGLTQVLRENLDTSKLFTSLILIALLASPLIRILQVIPSFGAAKGCFSRLQTFLEKNERIDDRVVCAEDAGVPHVNDATGQVTAEKRSDSGCVVTFQRADFGWTGNPHLRNINLDIQKGEHIVISGPVASGKSLLLAAILGETRVLSGSVHVGSSSIGYCGQTAWLENMTAEENALRQAPMDQVWRQKVIHACALDELLQSHGPGETIGSGGAKISGGERQRLAIARTIAGRSDIILLDDVFSALDRTTHKLVHERLFGMNGVFRQLGTTVIQTVQNDHPVKMADKVYRIDETGHLCPSEFVDSEQVHGDEGLETTLDHEVEKSAVTTGRPPQPSEQSGQASATRMADSSVYRTYFQSVGRLHTILFFVCGVFFAFCLKFPDLWVRWWSNANTKHPSQKYGYWIGIYAMLQCLPLLKLCFWFGHLMLSIVPKSGLGLHRRLLKAVLSADFVFISRVDSGSLMNRFNQDLMLVDLKLPLDLSNSASELFTGIFQVILVAVAAVYALAVLPVICMILYLIQHFYLRTSKQLRYLDLQSKSGLHTKLSETFAGLVTIRAHGWQDLFRQEFEEKLDRSQEPLYLLYMVQQWLQLTLNLVVAGLAITITGLAVGIRGKTSASAIGVAFLNMTTLGETLTTFIASWTSLETSLGAIARIQAFEKDTPVEPEVRSPVQLPPSWPASGNVQIDNLWTSYNSNARDPVWSLRGINLNVHAGEKIAICGRSGSGKSTLLLSLLQLIETQQGTITIDNVDISRVDRSLLRRRFHVISQDPMYAPGETVREALDPDALASDETINDVLRECSILDKINTCTADSGGGSLSAKMNDLSLSVGETQLFALARTILAAASSPTSSPTGAAGSIVLLDEATSSVDSATESKIMHLLATRLQGRTVISVLHRLESALAYYDRIVVLEKGEVKHLGTPERVVAEADLFAGFRR